MDKRGEVTVLGIQLEWVIIIVILLLGTIAVMLVMKNTTSNWLPIK